MPSYGTGFVPPAVPLGNEINAVTRRAFVPKLIVQIYKSTPALAAFLSGAQNATGGLSSVTVPIQGTSMVTCAPSGYAGTFNIPTQTAALKAAEFNLKLYITGIPFLSTEGLIQMDHAVVPILDARMNDAANVTKQTFATDLYGNYTDTSRIFGLPAAVDNAGNAQVYGGIDRNTYTWFRSLVRNASSASPTRALIMHYLADQENTTGEMPTFGLTDFGTWALLAQDFLGLERYNITPSGGFDVVQGGFRAIEVAGIPIYADPYAYTAPGLMYLLNTNYINLYCHQDATFVLAGPESLLANGQLGYVMALVNLLELVNTKPIASTRVYGLGYITF